MKLGNEHDKEISDSLDRIHKMPRDSISFVENAPQDFLKEHGSKTREQLIETIMQICGIYPEEVKGGGYNKKGFKKLGLWKIVYLLEEYDIEELSTETE